MSLAALALQPACGHDIRCAEVYQYKAEQGGSHRWCEHRDREAASGTEAALRIDATGAENEQVGAHQLDFAQCRCAQAGAAAAVDAATQV